MINNKTNKIVNRTKNNLNASFVVLHISLIKLKIAQRKNLIKKRFHCKINVHFPKGMPAILTITFTTLLLV